MFLLRSKVRGLCLREPFVIPARFDEEAVAALADRYRAGESGLRDRLIASQYRIAMGVASKYARLNPQHQDDLVGELMLALIRAVEAWREALTYTLSAFVTLRLHGAAADFLRAQRQMEQMDQEPSAPCRFQREVDLSDLALSGQEQAIVQLRMDGYTDEEIADQLGINQSTVTRRRVALGRRLAA